MDERAKSMAAPNPQAADPYPLLVLDVRGGVSNPPRLRNDLMQWHDDLQFVVVAEGEVEVDTPIGRTVLERWQGAFFNSRTMHRVKGRAGSMFMSFVFPAKVLGFFPGSDMAQNAVAPFVGDGAEPATYFDLSQDWHSELIGHLLSARDAALSGDAAAARYLVAVKLAEAWAVYIAHARGKAVDARTQVLNARMRDFVGYIEEHYAEQVSLDDIAAAGSVGKTECARCFREALGTTPYAYLTTHRISCACEAMREGRGTVTQIALDCGFGSASHFSKAFRAELGMSPREYLRALKDQ